MSITITKKKKKLIVYDDILKELNIVDENLVKKSVKLLKILGSIINGIHKNQILFLMKNLEISHNDLIKNFLDYNLDIFKSEGNLIYKSIYNRLVLHIHNLVAGSWHIEKQSTVLKFINLVDPKTIIEIGFGVPSRYALEICNSINNKTIVLADFYESAFLFAEKLLEYANKNWYKKIKFLMHDMNSLSFVGNFDLYIMLDSIEHIEKSAEYLINQVKLSSINSKFILSLPIGPIFPRHFIAWETDEDARTWLNNCGLSIETEEKIYVNPNIDLFAEQLNFNYYNLIVLCKKNISV